MGGALCVVEESAVPRPGWTTPRVLVRACVRLKRGGVGGEPEHGFAGDTA